jgi:hypothetical protein
VFDVALIPFFLPSFFLSFIPTTMIRGETILSSGRLSEVTGHEFCPYILIGKVVDKEGRPSVLGGHRKASLAANLPDDSFNGLYVVAAGVGESIMPVYCGMRSADESLKHRILCEFNYKQNEGSKKGTIQGPSRVWLTLNDIGVDAKYYVTYVRLDGLSMKEVADEETKILKKIDFIANAAGNGPRRIGDLEDIVKAVKALKAVEKLKKAEELKKAEAEELKKVEAPKLKTFSDVFKCLRDVDEHIGRIRAIPSFSTA